MKRGSAGKNDPLEYTVYTDDDGTKYVVWNTNIMGKLRIDLQTYAESNESFIGYTVMFIIMIIYLFIFTFTYLKRVVYMAFLTLIAPLVALTYPIDKMNDGSAQGFNMWFKEYMFNLLLQPLHLLLYIVLISSALALAQENPLYAIVAMGFMVPAENLLRQMFNFGKAKTPGVFGGAAGAAVVMSGMRWLTGHGPQGRRGRGGSGRDGDRQETDESGRIISSAGRNGINIGGVEDSDSEPIGANRDANKSVLPGGNDNTGNSSDSGSGGILQRETSQSQSIPKSKNLGENQNNNNRSAKQRLKAFPGNMARGIKGATGAYASGMKKKMKRNIENANGIRTLARIAGGAAVGATLGTVGLAAGAASGDLGKAAQYTGIAAAGGFKLGSSTTNAVADALTVEGTNEAFARVYYGEKEYQKKVAERNQKTAMENESYIKRVQEKLKLDRQQAKERLERMIPTYYDNKVTNIEDMVKMEKAADAFMEKYNQTEEDARKSAFIGWHTNNRYSLGSKLKLEDRKAIQQQIVKDNKNSNVTSGQARTMINYADIYREANEGM